MVRAARLQLMGGKEGGMTEEINQIMDRRGVRVDGDGPGGVQ